MEDFIHLHVHTQYSILDGQAPVDKLVDKAIANGMRGMAITDHGNMFGVKDLFDVCNKRNKALKKEGKEPFKPIFGCEVYVAPRHKEDKDKNLDRRRYHLILLAKNANGYRNLIELVSRSWVDGFYNKPRTDHYDLEKYHEGIICCSACIAGEVPRAILNDDIEGARKAIEWYKSIFGDDYYLELQRHEVKDPMQRANRETYPLQEKANKVLIELAKEYGVKLVCTNDCHFLDADYAEAHDHLLCLSTGKDLDDPSRMLYSKQEWFKTKEEMNEIFSDVPEALRNTCEILDKIETYDLESDPIMPFFPIPEDFGTEEEWRKKFSEQQLYDEFTSDENGENQLPQEDGEKKIKKLGGYDKIYRIKFEADYLAKLAYEGAQRIYGSGTSDNLTAATLIKGSYGIPEDVEDRIRFELHIMKTMGFPGYFLIVQDFINSARKELGVWVGPGRGSAAGSVVAYCLGITKIDPLKYDLLFERFLNPDRISLPDIDTDFDDDGRGKVLQWVMDKYGHENCAHIITYGTMAAKNALKDVGRVEKVPLSVVGGWCKAMPDRLPSGKKGNLTNYIAEVPELRSAETSPDETVARTIKIARQLEGTVRGTGIHACGFIICRDPISAHVPVSTADDPDFPELKTAVTQYDGHVIESTGLIKMDFLGLKTLSEQKEACKIIKAVHGVDIDLDHIPIDDELTYQLYQKGQTIGTFQFESAGMQKYLRELHPTVFEDLIAMNALYRPGPMDYIPSFIARKNGREPITYDIDCMETYLKDTYGITVYQEQVMLLSRQLANFTRGESDALRKAMGKKKKDIVDQMKPKFIEGGVKNGHDPKILEKIWADWEKFASYAFNKSHAACYSWVAYQTAYLKAHYPAEFMAAIMTRRKNDIKEITKLMDECKALGVPCLGPDVNESVLNFGVNKKGEVRFGLAAIKGVGENAVQAIISEREKNGPFKSVFDFMERVNFSQCNKKCIENLVIAGAFDRFTDFRRETFFALGQKQGEVFLDTLVRYGNNYQQDKYQSANSLFGSMGVAVTPPPIPKDIPHWGNLERLNKERELVGIYLSAHPLDEYAAVLKYICNGHFSDLAEDKRELLSGVEEVLMGGIVTGVRNGEDKRGNAFGVVKLEDFEGSGELALFGKDWMTYRSFFVEGSTLFLRLKVQPHPYRLGQFGVSLLAVDLLSEIKESYIESVTLTIPLDKLTEDLAEDLAAFVNDNPGKSQLIFNIHSGDSLKTALVSRSKQINMSAKFIKFIESQEDIQMAINQK